MGNSNSITLPPLEALDAAAHELLAKASASEQRAINKALWNLQAGLEIRPTTGGFLLPSGTRAGVIHRVSTVHGCSCEAAGKGHTCWHVHALAIVEEAQRHTMPALKPLGQRLAAARALAAVNELFN